MQQSYKVLRGLWPGAPDLSEIIEQNGRLVIFSGENEIHARGFFPQLTSLVASFGESEYERLDLDGGECGVAYCVPKTGEQYCQKRGTARECGPGRPFPYAVQHQCFIGEGNWLLLSDRDAEHMYFMAREAVRPEQLGAALQLIGSW